MSAQRQRLKQLRLEAAETLESLQEKISAMCAELEGLKEEACKVLIDTAKEVDGLGKALDEEHLPEDMSLNDVHHQTKKLKTYVGGLSCILAYHLSEVATRINVFENESQLDLRCIVSQLEDMTQVSSNGYIDHV